MSSSKEDKEHIEKLHKWIDDTNNLKNTVQSIFINQQQKYTYYLIALSIGSVAFSINQTIGVAFTNDLIIIGISLVFFLTSIGLGFKYLEKHLEHLSENIATLNAHLKGEYENSIEEKYDKIEGETKKSTRIFRVQKNFFYAGVITFIIWYLLVMYQNTIA